MGMSNAKIVVGIDFSAGSKLAAEAAIGLALDLGADLVMVHSFKQLPAPLMASHLYGDELTKIEREMEKSDVIELTEKWAERARAEGVMVEVIADRKDPVTLLLETAKQNDAAFIVVGSSGHSAFRRFMLGSVAQDVARKSTLPVLIVPLPE